MQCLTILACYELENPRHVISGYVMVKLHHVATNHHRYVPLNRMFIVVVVFFQIGGNQGKKNIGTELDAIQVWLVMSSNGKYFDHWLGCVLFQKCLQIVHVNFFGLLLSGYQSKSLGLF